MANKQINNVSSTTQRKTNNDTRSIGKPSPSSGSAKPPIKKG